MKGLLTSMLALTDGVGYGDVVTGAYSGSKRRIPPRPVGHKHKKRLRKIKEASRRANR